MQLDKLSANLMLPVIYLFILLIGMCSEDCGWLDDTNSMLQNMHNCKCKTGSIKMRRPSMVVDYIADIILIGKHPYPVV